MFVPVTVLFECGYRVDGDSCFPSGLQDDDRRDEIPGFDRDDVGGEEVEFVERVGFFDKPVAAELAKYPVPLRTLLDLT